MKDFKYHLSVENCRAIKSAEIDLSEITVLTGVNASGKSTIARMFRDLVEMSAEYERLLAVQMWNSSLDQWRYALGAARSGPQEAVSLRYVNIADRIAHGTLTLEAAVSMLEHVLEGLDFSGKGREQHAFLLERMRRLLNLSEQDVDILAVFRAGSERVLEKFNQRKINRTYGAYRELMRDNPLFEGQVSLREGAYTVFSSDMRKGTFGEVSFIKRAIYIESPFKSVPRSISTTDLDMGDAFSRVKDESVSVLSHGQGDLFRVLAGGIDYKRDFNDEDIAMSALLGRQGKWVYNREDGASFSLEECATGIRALSILNILYSKGWLDPETLLIIDEPEAHLHPQWIVEYARILLLLSKRLRVRIIITSHSPDMVNALHTMGMAMGMGDVINFYLAEADEKEKYKFKYRPLKNKVGDIFKAYNVSFDRIDSYARSVGDNF